MEKDTKFKPGNETGKDTRFKKGNTLRKKYKPEYADSLLAYFLSCDHCPTLEEWAVNNNLKIRTVYDWTEDEEKYPRFATTYAQAKAIQKNNLVQNGLTERYNASIVKFLLINTHGMSEKIEQKVDGKTDASITVNIREVN